MLLTKLPCFSHHAVLTFVFIFLCCFIHAKPATDSVINIADVQNSYLLHPDQYRLAVTDHMLTDIEDIPQLDYKPIGNGIPGTGKLRSNINSQYIYLKFTLVNRSNTAQQIYLYAGYYFKKFRLYRQLGPGQEMMELPEGKVETGGYQVLEMGPGEAGVYYCLLQPVKIQVNTLRAEMVHPSFVKLHYSASRNSNEVLNIFTFILVGILCMMIIFSFSNYLFNRKKEFLYYSIFALFNATILFFKAQLYLSTSRFNILFEEYFDFMLLLAGLLFYMAFLRKFLSISKTRYPVLHKMILAMEGYLILSAIVYSVLYFVSDNLYGLELIEMLIKYIIVVAGAVFIVLGLKQRNKLMNYIVLGNACIILFGFISMTITMAPVLQNSLFSHALFYYELGIVGEFSFFLLGLTYKNRMELINRIKQEQAILKSEEKLEYEKQLAIMKTHQDERNRISADMHDELGGGMTAIRLLSELAKHRTNPEALPEIEKISLSASDLLGKMNAIIWSMKVSNDSLDHLIDYIKHFTHEFFETNNISYTIGYPEMVPEIEVSGIVRRNLFLAYKELAMLIRNVAAEKVAIQLTIEPAVFTIRLECQSAKKTVIPENTRGLVRKRMDLINGRVFVSDGDTERFVMLQVDI